MVAVVLSLAADALAGPITLPTQPTLVAPLDRGHAHPSQAPQAPEAAPEVTAIRLETDLREHGDLQQILLKAPALLARAPESESLHHLYAVALAASRQPEQALAALEAAPGPSAAGWDAVARALIARDKGQLGEAADLIGQALRADSDNAYAHNAAGTIALAGNALPRATTHFQQATKLAPDSALYLGNLGAGYLHQGRLQEAAPLLRQALTLAPDDCAARTNHAALLAQAGALAAARNDLEACLQTRPDFTQAADALFDLLLRQADHGAAEALLQRTPNRLSRPHLSAARLALQRADGTVARRHLQHAPPSAETDLLDALAHAMQGRWQTAADRSRDLAGRHPTQPLIIISARALALATHAALADEGWAVPEDPALAAAMQFLAGLEAAMAGNQSAIETAFRQADGMLPGLSLAGLGARQHQALDGAAAVAPLAAGFLFQLWQFDDAARTQLQQATAAAPELALPQLLLARLAARAGHRNELAQALERALERAPGSYSANLLSAEQALAEGDLATALPLLINASAAHADPDTLLRTGLVAETLADDTNARRHYEQLLALQPDSFIANNQLAWFLAVREQELERAMALATTADRLQPGNASIQHTIGYIHFLNGQHADALEHVRNAFRIAGWEVPLIGLTLARTELAVGNRDTARSLLQRLAEGPEDAQGHASAARELLEGL